MNERGYTLLEALFQLVVFMLIAHLVVFIMLWFAEMKVTVLSDEQSKWELFVYDLNMYLEDISSFTIRKDQKRITFQAADATHNIDCYSNIIRDQVKGGHVPLLIGINKCQFKYEKNMLTVTVELPSGIQKERTFYVPVIEK
ncbi:competence type IV pilus minor pilin ComGF [Lysinibacillus sp. G4S2]|uniref:competence type IV pilus minor pilin ComGF n=1 Tax=Lysinibacillus sp. G4S2 TaxID=3055859 RepID=UPI0025A187B2|nr:competence type IV pilus minor pilin ComGF [Lysinibacillus sp. G4S2]MDM5249192.1 competence type IV pilus minor pilin ComGF [Lysinibacillus sp. G4S2]